MKSSIMTRFEKIYLRLKSCESDEEIALQPKEKPANDESSQCNDTDSRGENKIGNMQCVAHTLRANVIPTGVLTLPLAFKHAGLWVGFIGTATVVFLCAFCMRLLARTSFDMKQSYHSDAMTYAGTMEIAISHHCKSKNIVFCARTVVNFFLFLTYFGICSMFITFMGSNLKQFVEFITVWSVPEVYYQALVVAFLVPFTWISSLKTLALFSMLGNFNMITALTIVIQYCVSDLPPSTELPAYTDVQSLVPFLATVVLSVCSIGLVLPIMHSMKEPEEFLSWNGVLNTFMTFVGGCYLTIGFFGYLRFGLDSNPPLQAFLSSSMPPDHWLYVTIKLLYVIAVFFTYALMIYVPVHVICTSIENFTKSNLTVVIHRVVRTTIVMLTFVLAAFVPRIDRVWPVVLSITIPMLTLVFPPCIEVLHRYPDNLGSRGKGMLVIYTLVVLCGVTVCLISFTYTVSELTAS